MLKNITNDSKSLPTQSKPIEPVPSLQPHNEPIHRPPNLIELCAQVTKSMAFTIVLSYFEIEDAISFQLLNKHMYYVKTPIMTDVILGKRIDPHIILYSEYKNKKGAISLIVGIVPPAD